MSPSSARDFGRVDYTQAGLAESDLTQDPFTLFETWYDEADEREANAMVLGTVAPGSGQPSSRTVLLKGLQAEGEPGFVLYTNLASRKGVELAAEPRCSLLFPWYVHERQVRVDGTARRTSRATDEAYFASRPRDSQLGAWASVDPVPQSGVVSGREALQEAYDDAERRFEGGDVPCPETWGGFLVVPEAIEFWQGRHGRVHDRLRYVRDGEGWRTERLAP